MKKKELMISINVEGPVPIYGILNKPNKHSNLKLKSLSWEKCYQEHKMINRNLQKITIMKVRKDLIIFPLHNIILKSQYNLANLPRIIDIKKLRDNMVSIKIKKIVRIYGIILIVLLLNVWLIWRKGHSKSPINL